MSHELHPCYVCGKSDADPKHQHVPADGSSVFHHIDCGALIDPPCGSCKVLHDELPKVKGDKLRAHLIDLGPRVWHQPDGLYSPATHHAANDVDGCDHCDPVLAGRESE